MRLPSPGCITLVLASLALSGCKNSQDNSDIGDVGAVHRTSSPELVDERDASTDDEGEPAPLPREVTIGATGDLLVHRKVLAAARANEGGFEYVLETLGSSIKQLEAPRIAFVNLETPLSEAYNSPYNANPPVLGSPPDLAPALKALSVDVVSVANNHALDQTSDGLADTLELLAASKLGAIGAGVDREAALQPWIMKRGGLKVGFLGFAGHVNRGPGRTAKTNLHIARIRDEAEALEAIEDLREQVDVVVVAVHWSHDFMRRPAQSQRNLAKKMVVAGADLILGTGPHVLQEVERLESPRGDALVAYSLGNLISNQGLRYKVGHRIRPDEHPVAITPGTRDVVLLSVRLRSQEPGQVEIASVEAHVMWVVNNFWDRRLSEEVPVDIKLARLSDVDEALRTERLEAVGDTLGPEVTLVP